MSLTQIESLSAARAGSRTSTRRPAIAELLADLRPPMYALAVLGLLMSVAFPAYRLLAPREGYILHLSDDAFYYLSVAPHIAGGQGPTADGITRTTGWHPLYGFLLAGMYRLTSPSLDGFVKQAIALDSVFYLLSAWMLFLAARAWWGRAAGRMAALLWLCNPHGVLITQQGLESGLYAFCLSLLLWRAACFVTRPAGAASFARACVELGFIAGLVLLSRTDALLLVPALGLVLLFHARGGIGVSTVSMAGPGAAPPSAPTSAPLAWTACLAGLAIFGLLVSASYGAWLGYVWHYTQELNQGSAAVKMQWRKFEMSDKNALAVAGTVLAMWAEFALESYLKVPAFKWVLTGIPLLVRRCRSWADRGLLHLLWAVPVALGLAYGLLLDWTRSWYYLPGLLTVTLMCGGAFQALTDLPSRPEPAGGIIAMLQRLVSRTAGLIVWVVVIESAVLAGRGILKELESDSEKIWALRCADWLTRNAEPGLRIGAWHSGIIGYYTPGLDVINLDGLNNNDILQILRGRTTLNEYWLERRIQAVIVPAEPDPKMGRFDRQWAGHRLERWDRTPEGRRLAGSLDIDDQVFGQRIYRVMTVGSPSTQAVHGQR